MFSYTVDKFNSYILGDHIRKLQPKTTSECILYIHGKEMGSQKFEEPFYTFFFGHNTTEYIIPIKKEIIKDIVYYRASIYYHYNHSGQMRMKSLLIKTVFKGDKFFLYSDDKLHIELTLVIKNMSIKKEIVNEIHKPARKNYPPRKVEVRGLNEFSQGDLVEMIPYGNKGFRYILVVIDVFTKFVWVELLKRKQGKNIISTMKKILSRLSKSPKYLQTHNGKEFHIHTIKNLMESYKILHFSSFFNLKASVVERVNRTLKRYMWKEFRLQRSYKWLNILSDNVNKYYNQKHSTIKIKPSQATEKMESGY